MKSIVVLGVMTALTACNGGPLFRATKLLRNPEKCDHTISYEQKVEEGYIAFKDKLETFSHKISESFVKKEFKDNKNITISPFSIEMCLGLAVRSANNKTRQEMLDAMGVDYATFNKYYRYFFNENQFEHYSGYNQLEGQLLVTNSIWIDDEISLYEETLDALRDDYYCYSYEADFNKNNQKTCNEMEKFISEKTKGLIKPTLELDPSTLFVLMNTLYLKDIWNDYGEDLNYADSKYTFTNYDKSVSKNRLLQGYYNNGRTLVTDDYSSFFTTTLNGFKLNFVKANAGKKIEEVFNKEAMSFVMNADNYIYKDDEKLERYHTNCVFPEYKADADLSLNEILIQDLGIISMFNPNVSDFSSISDQSVYVDDVRHIAKLEVNKKGIEGAAVTYMAMCGTSAPGPEEYKDIYETFVVDQEFGFILSRNDAVLFSGIVTNIDK